MHFRSSSILALTALASLSIAVPAPQADSAPPQPCVFNNKDIIGQNLADCLIIGGHIMESTINNSIILNPIIVQGSTLNFAFVTNAPMQMTNMNDCLLQNTTVNGGTLTRVAAQLTNITGAIYNGMNLQVGSSTDSNGEQVTIQNSIVNGKNNFIGATIQDCVVSEGNFNTVAFSKCDAIEDSTIIAANFQDVNLIGGTVNGANLQDFSEVGTTLEGDIHTQQSRAPPAPTPAPGQ